MNYLKIPKEQLIAELNELKRENENLRASFVKEINALKYSEHEWKQIKEKLTESEKRYRGLFENMKEGFAYCKMLYENGKANDFVYLMVNNSFETLTGLKEVTGKHVSEVIPGIRESDPVLFEVYDRVSITGQPERFEMYVEAMNMWFSVSVYSPEKEFFVAVFDVITQRKKVEEVLTHQQYLLETILNNLPDHIYFKDLESRFIRINVSHAKSLGLADPDQAVGKKDSDFHTPEHASQAYKDEQTVIQTGQPLTKEERLVYLNHPDKWVLATKLPFRNNEGKIIGTFGISRDITKRKQAEDAYSKLSLRQEAILAAVPEIIMEVDKNKIYKWANRPGLEFFGKDVIGKEASFYFEGEQETYNMVQQLFDGVEDKLNVESWQRRYDGEKRLLDWWCQVFKDHEGRVIGALSFARDITERKRAEETLAKEQYLLTTLMNNLPDHIYFKDLESHFIRINVSHAKSLGLSDPDQAIGKTDFDFHTPEHTRQAYYDEQAIIQTEQPLTKEERLVHANSPDSWVYATKLPFRDKEGKIIGTFGISRDITSHKLAEEEIKLKNELLQTINAEKDKFFSILAHDLKGPLSAFMGASQILTEEIQNMTLEEIKEITINMKESATNIYGLLVNLLEWSKLKRGMMDFVPEVLNVKQKTTGCIEVLLESARKKKIKINYSLPEGLEIYADSHMFETVIRNLVSNAIKFTPKSGEIDVSASVTPDNNVEINICDTGIGMSKELISKLFLLNEKTNRKGTDGEPSTGLGLLLCKEFIEKLGGKIHVQSEEGKGSTFSFTI
jgi:PAS domain S-box-containing protein